MSVYSAGAFHTVVAGWRPVWHRSTLAMLARAGWILLPVNYGRTVYGPLGPVTVRYVYEGPNGPGMGMFNHRKRTFRLQWADGCFHPFVWEATQPESRGTMRT